MAEYILLGGIVAGIYYYYRRQTGLYNNGSQGVPACASCSAGVYNDGSQSVPATPAKDRRLATPPQPPAQGTDNARILPTTTSGSAPATQYSGRADYSQTPYGPMGTRH
jgi:hypothetical protein